MREQPQLLSIFLVFLKMGSTAFGGNVALVAAIRREVCEKRKWMTDQDILDLMVIGNILPGPLATNVVFAIGKILRGVAGAFVALLGVLLPSFILMCFLSWAYFKFGNSDVLTRIMNGIIPAVAAIVAATALNLHKKNVKGVLQFVIVLLSASAMLLWKDFFLTLIIVGVAAVIGRVFMSKTEDKLPEIKVAKSPSVFVLPAIVFAIFIMIIFVPSSPLWIGSLKSLALTFGSMSVTLFGGGYVFIPAMESVVVHEMSWMTTREFTEGIALGQITPGPIMISSVFIGWKVAGLKGAITAAVFLFVPPAVIMYVAHHFLAKIKSNANAESIFRGVRPAVIGMIFSSVWVVFSSGNVNIISGCIFAGIFAIALWKNPEPILLILGSAVIGFFLC